jgi:cold shock CspA family protein
MQWKWWVQVAKGKIRAFDDERGFGFIKTADAPDDVFFHIKDVAGAENEDLTEGVWVDFTLTEGDRGLKATQVRLQSPSRSADRAPAASSSERPRSSSSRGGALPMDQYRREITEILLSAVDDLEGRQIVALRDVLTDYGIDRGFVSEGR